jgi:hypothetical protein
MIHFSTLFSIIEKYFKVWSNALSLSSLSMKVKNVYCAVVILNHGKLFEHNPRALYWFSAKFSTKSSLSFQEFLVSNVFLNGKNLMIFHVYYVKLALNL